MSVMFSPEAGSVTAYHGIGPIGRDERPEQHSMLIEPKSRIFSVGLVTLVLLSLGLLGPSVCAVSVIRDKQVLA